jgi:hypothetical protein
MNTEAEYEQPEEPAAETADDGKLTAAQAREEFERELAMASETFGRAATDAEFDEALMARGVISQVGGCKKRIDVLIKRGAFVVSNDKVQDPNTKKMLRRTGIPPVVPDGATREQANAAEATKRANLLAGMIAVHLATRLNRAKKLEISANDLWPMIEETLTYIREFDAKRGRTIDDFAILLDELSSGATKE